VVKTQCINLRERAVALDTDRQKYSEKSASSILFLPNYAEIMQVVQLAAQYNYHSKAQYDHSAA
jgi:hypothetical protein